MSDPSVQRALEALVQLVHEHAVKLSEISLQFDPATLPSRDRWAGVTHEWALMK